MSGIVRYGTYVPFFRIQRSAIGSGRGERATASYDENSVSMAVEASRDALSGVAAPDTIIFATTSAPYAEKLNAATIHAALDLPPEVTALDSTGSTRSGLTSFLLAADLAEAGKRVLATAGEVVIGAPGGGRESAGGDGACSFLFGSDDEAIARIVGRASITDEMLDVWRTPDMKYAKQWEERFGADVFEPLLQEVCTKALDDAGCTPDQLSKVLFDGNNMRAVRTVLKTMGLPADVIADDLSGTVGRTGAAHVGLMLANVLDKAEPGDRILAVCGADGVDAMVLEVTDRITKARPKHSVQNWIDSKRNDLAYTNYLKWRGILDFEPPRRPDPPRPAAPPMRRADRWKFAFVGSKCTECGAAQLPPQRVCVMCQATDKMEPISFADAECNIATYTVDRLAYSLQPPVVVAVVDFKDGGRYTCQLTDVDPENVHIGDELEMTFRLFYTADGVHNYFWKARPQR